MKRDEQKFDKKKYLTPYRFCVMMLPVSEKNIGDAMEKIVEQGILYDFYGELLTAHQRSIYEDAVYNDLSLSEIAEANGITRQGVHDLIKRCDKILAGYEQKLHLVEKFTNIKRRVAEVEALTAKAQENGSGGAWMQQVSRLAQEILEEL